MNQSFLAIAACLVAAGCAAPEPHTESNASRGEYRTGSNIPRKNDGTDRVEVVKPEELERSRAGQPGMPTGR